MRFKEQQNGRQSERKTGKHRCLKAVTVCLLVLAIVVPTAICLIRHVVRAGNGGTSAVTVRTPYLSGQGVVYEKMEKGICILTTGHVLSGLENGASCTVGFADGSTAQASVLYRSDTADVAFLYVEKEDVPKGVRKVKTDKKTFDALAEGDVLCAEDLNGTQTEQIQGNVVSPWIWLEDFALNMMLAKIPCRNGMSGCGIYDAKGNFVGILCGSSAEGEVAVLPLSVIESEWIMAEP